MGLPIRKRSLTDITADIKQTIGQFTRGTMRLGELLLEARDRHFGGRAGPEFQDYVAKHVVSPMTGQTPALVTVQKWIKAAQKLLADQDMQEVGGVPPTSQRSETSVSDKRSPTHPSHKLKLDWKKQVRKVQGGIDADKIRAQYEDERKREKAQRKLAKDIITAGYRALSAVVHPDKKGGNTEAFKALTQAKKWLMELIEE
jgi:hypothetical protein